MVLRRAMANILPEEVRWRGGKTNMSPNFEHGLWRFCKENLEDVIQKKPGIIEKYVDINGLCKAYGRFISREGTDDDVLSIWRATTLALWLEHTCLTPE